MAVARHVNSQVDFSSGEPNIELKRLDENPLHKAGGRQVRNYRILHTGQLNIRPGRRLLFLQNARTDEVEVASGVFYRLSFTDGGGVVIRDADGLVVASQADGSFPWRHDTLRYIVWTSVKQGSTGTDVIVCFTGMKPTAFRYAEGVWTFIDFGFQVDSQGNELVPFYRFADPGTTMNPAGVAGSFAVVFSDDVLDTSTPSKHLGVQFRYAGRRVIVTAVADARNATVTAIDRLPGQQTLTLKFAPVGEFEIQLGDVIIGSITQCEAIVTAVASPNITVQIINNVLSGFSVIQTGVSGEDITTPSTHNTVIAKSAVGVNPAGISVWEEQMMSDAKGWPQSCFFDQNRLGLCDFPQIQSAIAWSWISQPFNFDAGGNSGAIPTADFAIVELVPGRRRVLYVVAGPESSEFVFTDRSLYYIPINTQSPLKPGSIEFKILTSDGCAQIQPRVMEDLIIYAVSGQISINAVLAPGAYYRPYQVSGLSHFHNHLVQDPICIGVPTGDFQYDERYFYVLNADGSLAVAKVDIEGGAVKGVPGWVRWDGTGFVDWVSVIHNRILFSCHYDDPGLATCETLDAEVFVDQAISVNVAPIALAPPATKGPLWYIASSTVTLMDQSYRMMGEYDVDENGFLIPQGIGGEDLTRTDLIAGRPFTAVFEPFVPAAQAGQDVSQRVRKRRLSRVAIYVKDSTGFLFQRIFAGPLRPGGPPLGTVMAERRVPAWNQDDDATLPPPLREQTYSMRPLGREADPRVTIVKDTPGPIQILEVATQVTA